MILNKISAFVSSRTRELNDERIITKTALESLHLGVFVFEDDAGARTESSSYVYREEVEGCDICVCIFGTEYSQATEEEYNVAYSNGKEILVYVSNFDVEDRDTRVKNLLGEIKKHHTIQEFNNILQLEEFVKRDIMKMFFRKFNELKINKTQNQQTPINDFYTIHEYLIKNGPVNPHFLNDVNPIAGEIIAVWNAIGYMITKFEVVDKTVDFQGEISDWTGTRRVIVRCVDGEVSYNDVKFVKTFVETNSQFSGYVFTYNRIAPSAKELANQHPVILVQTQSEFYRKLINPEKYISFLRKKYEKSDIAKYYVKLDCYKENILQGGDFRKEAFGDLEKYVDGWLQDKSKKQISILGEFGTGKTWFCLQYAIECLQKYIQDPYNNRLPILISLRDYAKSYDIKQLITDLLLNEYGFSFKNYEMFDVLNNQGKFLLIFDGFDEMAVRVDYGVVIDNFWELAKVVVPSSKVLLTCRTTHFRYAIESENILSGKEKSRNMNTINRPGFEILHLEEFSEDKIIEVMTKRIGDPEKAISYWNKLKPIYDIPSIAHKPVLIPMLIEVMPDLVNLEIVTPATIYHIYTNQWIEKSLEEKRTYLKSKWDKLFFIKEIAWQMIKSKDLKIFWKEIPDFINRHFNFDKKEIDYYEHDLRNNSFLRRDEKGVFEFTHKSMAEFFVAYKFALELGSIKPEYVKDIPVEQTKQRPINDLATTFGYTLLTPEIRLFLQDMIENRSTIREIFDRSMKNIAESNAFVSSNLITLLLMMGESFESQNLSLANIPGAELQGRKLIKCNFDGGNLSKCNMTDSILEESTFNNSNLSGTSMIHSHCHAIKGENINLTNCDCSKSILSSVDLEKCDLSNSIFSKASLKDGLFINSTINGSDFTNSDLSNASLENSHIENCIFDGTDLTNVSLRNTELVKCNFHTHLHSRLRIDGSDLIDSVFENLDAPKTKLVNRRLLNSTLLHSNFHGSYFTSSTLKNCNLHHSDLSNCDFIDAILTNTLLTETDLSDSNFSGADLGGTNLTGCKANVIHVNEKTNTKGMKIDRKTFLQLPENFCNLILRDNPNIMSERI